MIRSHDDLHKAFREAVEAMGVSCELLDEISGLQGGYVAKLLAPVPIRKIGPVSFDALLGATGKMLVMVDDPEALARIANRLKPRNKSQVRASVQSDVVHVKFTKRHFKKIGRKGGANSRRFMSRARARKLARIASLARWDRERARRESAAAKAAQVQPIEPCANPAPRRSANGA